MAERETSYFHTVGCRTLGRGRASMNSPLKLGGSVQAKRKWCLNVPVECSLYAMYIHGLPCRVPLRCPVVGGPTHH